MRVRERGRSDEHFYQRGRGEQLNSYKLSLIEPILKHTLRSAEGQDLTTLRSAVKTAVEVAQWEMGPPR